MTYLNFHLCEELTESKHTQLDAEKKKREGYSQTDSQAPSVIYTQASPASHCMQSLHLSRLLSSHDPSFSGSDNYSCY